MCLIPITLYGTLFWKNIQWASNTCNDSFHPFLQLCWNSIPLEILQIYWYVTLTDCCILIENYALYYMQCIYHIHQSAVLGITIPMVYVYRIVVYWYKKTICGSEHSLLKTVFNVCGFCCSGAIICLIGFNRHLTTTKWTDKGQFPPTWN